jgi:TusA-related sulfurtransferase
LITEFFGPGAEPSAEIEKTDMLVTLPEHGQQRVTYSLNLLGETCLRIYLVTKKIFNNARAGEVMEVVTDNLASIETIQFMAPTYDFLHLATLHDEGTWRLYLRKENGWEEDPEKRMIMRASEMLGQRDQANDR